MVKTRGRSAGGGVSKFATGKYVGNGAATQAIVGVGFQPKYVVIYNQVDASHTPAFENTSDAGTAKTWSSISLTFNYQTDMIISLDADGFTVGDGSTYTNLMNLNGVTYTFTAWG